jgi:hypothetical protein
MDAILEAEGHWCDKSLVMVARTTWEGEMSRLSFRPRPLDIHKKLPIVKSVKDFEDDDAPTTSSTRNSHLFRLASDVDNDVRCLPFFFSFLLIMIGFIEAFYQKVCTRDI